MNALMSKTRKLTNLVNRANEDGTKEYLIISDFGNSSIQSEPYFSRSYFRIFTPVKSDKGRRLNPLYGGSFNPFKDTLMDYPTIVQHKLGKVGAAPWDSYNRLISLQIPRCPLACWHCYLDECLKSGCDSCPVSGSCDGKRRVGIEEDWFSSKKIVDDFVDQRIADKNRGLSSNILRITGGEPFLASRLLIEILRELKNRQLDKEALLWTETNLVPLIVQDNGDAAVSDDLLKELGTYHNFCTHPCFHGLNEKDFEEITGERVENFDLLVDALKRMLNAGIDVYPSFGSNMSAPESIESFYNRISEVDKLLPLRFSLIEYDLDYKPVKWRREKIPGFARQHEKVYDRFQTLEKWSELLSRNTGYNYGDIPRHLVPLVRR